MPAVPHIFGIRHHGPGSARSLVRALDTVKPDVVLIEGPPDADGVLALADHEEMVPPLAILVYAADDAKRAVYYPFAEFSPEWQAIKWALGHGVPVRFMDLPQTHRMALDIEAEKKAAEPQAIDPEDAGGGVPPAVPAWRGDPLRALAEAAGFDDGERWWEHAVEHRTGGGTAVFAALTEAMAALREQGDPTRGDDQLREAWMRRTIREAQTSATNLAVVCGAWHAPALDVSAVTKADDEARLKGLPKIKTTATWVPWTYDRLTVASGYGAGVQSPGWYEHLWRHNGDDHPHVLERWMTRVARLLREKDIDCSSAHVIEAVRLSHGLAGMRARPIPDLADIADATRSVFCFDSDLPMRLIGRELLVGHRLGEVRDDTPMVPLQQHLTRLQKSLRFKPEALEKTVDFDLRNETDLARSRLLHQLRLLGVPWGTPKPGGGGKGTFHELWQVRWEPEFAVRLIERGGWGNTVDAAASAYVRDQADHQEDLPRLAAMLGDVMLADLPDAVAAVMAKIESAAAVSADLNTLMAVVPPLAGVLRYGNVRQTDAGMVRHALDGLLPRVTVGLGAAVASLNDEAAKEMERRIVATHAAVQLIQAERHLADWLAALVRVSDQPSVHGLLRGRCARLAFDAGRFDSDAAAERMSLALSRGTDPTAAAMWVEGFLRDSGLLLLHDAKLLGVLDDWVGSIATDVFNDMVPLLRRTFGTYPAAERRQLGKQLAAGGGRVAKPLAVAADVNEDRARRVLPILATLLST